MNKSICKKCGFSWLPRTEMPIKCPSCQSKYWNEEKKNDSKTTSTPEKNPPHRTV